MYADLATDDQFVSTIKKLHRAYVNPATVMVLYLAFSVIGAVPAHTFQNSHSDDRLILEITSSYQCRETSAIKVMVTTDMQNTIIFINRFSLVSCT
jgi:hypothetical protein